MIETEKLMIYEKLEKMWIYRYLPLSQQVLDRISLILQLYIAGRIGWNRNWSTRIRSITSICQSRRTATKTRCARLSLWQNKFWNPQRTCHYPFGHNVRPKRHWRAFATSWTFWPGHPNKIDSRSIDSQLCYERGCRLFRLGKWMGSWLLKIPLSLLKCAMKYNIFNHTKSLMIWNPN